VFHRQYVKVLYILPEEVHVYR